MKLGCTCINADDALASGSFVTGHLNQGMNQDT